MGKKALLFSDEFNGGKDNGEAIFEFLKNWLSGHIMTIDHKYVECFKENGLS